jgi:hypothetical protein
VIQDEVTQVIPEYSDNQDHVEDDMYFHDYEDHVNIEPQSLDGVPQKEFSEISLLNILPDHVVRNRTSVLGHMAIASLDDINRQVEHFTKLHNLPLMAYSGAIQNSSPSRKQTLLQGPDYEKWRAAEKLEMDMHRERGTLIPDIPVEEGYEPIDVKWVYQIKDNGTRFKARVVACGNREGTLDEGTYSPTSNKPVMWLLLALWVILRLYARVIDITGAFVAEKITRKVWVRIDGVVYKLGTFLYGLVDAGKEFYDRSSEHLVVNGFKRSLWDRCLFVKWDSYFSFTYVIVHVDDFLCLGSSKKELDSLCEVFNKKYAITVEPLEDYLGLHIDEQLDHSVIFTRPKQLNKIFNIYIKEGDKTIYPRTPMLIGKSIESTTDQCDLKTYQELLGSLIQIIDVRPDIAYAVSRCAQRTQYHLQSDMKALMRIVYYLKGTETLGIKLQPGNHQHGSTYVMLRGYTDASYGGEPGAKSMYCVSYDMIPVPLDWHTSAKDLVLQRAKGIKNYSTGHFHTRNSTIPDVSLSSTDAETYGIVEAMKDIIFFRGVMIDLHQPQLSPTILYNDNQSAMTLATVHTGNVRKSRYLMPRINWMVEQTEKGIVETHWMPTENLTPDIGTKSLPIQDFLNKRTQELGMQITETGAGDIEESVL